MPRYLGHAKSRGSGFSTGPGRTSANGTRSMGAGFPGRTSAGREAGYAGTTINRRTGRGTIGAAPSVLPYVAPGNQR
jgi:hypothetical protein